MRTRLICSLVVGLALAGIANHILWGQAPPLSENALRCAAPVRGKELLLAANDDTGDELIANAPAHLVLDDDFSGTPSGEWSHAQTSQTPIGGKSFLGEFGPEVVTLVLRKLPEHKLVHISFDLYLMRSWDGSNDYWGPDIWQLSLLNGPTLIRSTFNNCDHLSNHHNTEQAYPDDYPCPPHAAFTGSKEKDTLGYEFDLGRGSPLCDAVYHIEAIVPHEESKIAFQFAAFFNDRIADDQSWGIANVKVQTVEALQKLSADELSDCWEKLAGSEDDESVEAVQAMWRMVASGDDATGFIVKTLHLDGKPGEFDLWQVRRAKRALQIIDTPAARHALWILSEPAKFSTEDEKYTNWGLHEMVHP